MTVLKKDQTLVIGPAPSHSKCHFLPPSVAPPLSSGMFFYWQVGALDAITAAQGLFSPPPSPSSSSPPSPFAFSGASAGSLTAVLAACGVKGRHAAEEAFRVSSEHGLWDRGTGGWVRGCTGAWVQGGCTACHCLCSVLCAEHSVPVTRAPCDVRQHESRHDRRLLLGASIREHITL